MGRHIFFLGKGGVGKSTLSSVLACKMQETKKILHISLDPAHNLGDIYGKRLSERKVSITANLQALEVDLSLWMDRYLQWSREELKRQYSYNVTINLDSFFNILKYSPGTEEYAVLWAIEQICKENEQVYDTLIFDTPPTALSLRFLSMPSLSMRWISELRKMREKILAGRQTLLRINPESQSLRGAARKEDDQVYGKLAQIHYRLEFMYNLFKMKSYLVVVVNEDKLSLAESVRIKEELARLEIPLSAVCLNKTGCTDLDETTPQIKSAFPAIPVFSSEIVPGGINSIDDLAGINLDDLLSDYLSGENI